MPEGKQKEPDLPHYPRIHVVRTIDYGDHSVRQPLSSPVCDFCGHDSPAWDYDCHDFVVPEDPALSSMNGFAACTPCSDMIEADNWEGVLERAVGGARRFGDELAERIRVSAGYVHRGFRENRYGDRRPWG